MSYMPAYCDPENERRGAQYAATKSLGVVEIAKLMRADIKALNLREGFKVSVRTRKFSGGCAIDIDVTAIPADFKFYAPAAASWFKQFPLSSNRIPMSNDAQESPEYAEVIGALKRIQGAYNRNNSDAMSDYFDVRYYGSVSFDWQSPASAMRKAEIEAADGNYWSEGCV